MKETGKKGFYLKWSWSLAICILLLVLLRLIAVPFILPIVWWSKKQQPDGPDQGKYMVEIGAPVHGSPCLWERVVSDVCVAIACFFAAYHLQSVDVSGHEKMEL